MVDTKKSAELPVTQKMLNATRNELKSEFASVFLKIDAVNKKVDAVDKKVDALKDEMNSRFSQSDSKLEKVLAAIHRMTALVEEQDNRNKYVLDGYAVLNARMDRLEQSEN
ncbi:hypothetical protein COB52_05405 [Candidatus Kaiserbacteria bacterium]|nr:MAG: hypothetical protein COB52_05405 [Candidatus Kaiserbacteria bacterium]